MDHCTPKMTFCLVFWMIFIDGAAPTCGRAINPSIADYYDQPLKSFVLTVEDKPEPTKVTTVKTDSGPTEQFFSGKPNATQVPTITGSGSKEPVPEGSTNYVVIIGVVFAVIIVAILIVFLVVVYVHRMHLLEY
nr:uncharacterized protein LOC131771900 isoform X3 [Pocillopora verrucosa]